MEREGMMKDQFHYILITLSAFMLVVTIIPANICFATENPGQNKGGDFYSVLKAEGLLVPATGLFLDEDEIIDSVKKSISSLRPRDEEEKDIIIFPLINPSVAAFIAIKENLSIIASKIDEKNAATLIQKARSVFDPLLEFSYTYVNSDNYTRTENDYKWKRATVSYDDGNDPRPVYLVRDEFDQLNIEYIQYSDPQAGRYKLTEIEANSEKVAQPEDSSIFSVTLAQKIPWGLDLSLSLKSLKQNAFWYNNFDGSFGNYDRDWKSTFTQAFSIPLPRCKDFGPVSLNHTKIRLSKFEKELKEYEINRVLNEMFYNIESAYWKLVKHVLNLNAILRYRVLVNSLWKDTKKLYYNGEATKQDLWQVELEQIRSVEKEHQEISFVILASNHLSSLLNEKGEAITLPSGFIKLLKNSYIQSTTNDMIEKIPNNPEVAIQAVKIKIAELILEQNKIQKRPDIRLFQSLMVTQEYSGFGYKQMGESIGDLFKNKDLIRQDYTIAYQYPIRNREAASRIASAKLALKKEKIIKAETENSIIKSISDARMKIASSIESIWVILNNLRVAKKVVDEASERQMEREITEFEIVTKYADILNIEFSYINVCIEKKQAEVALLYALGQFLPINQAHIVQ